MACEMCVGNENLKVPLNIKMDVNIGKKRLFCFINLKIVIDLRILVDKKFKA